MSQKVPIGNLIVSSDQIQEVVKRRILNRQGAVHVRRAGGQSGLPEKLSLNAAIMQANRNGRFAVAKSMDAAVRVDHGQFTNADE
jgi:hypothetical protein